MSVVGSVEAEVGQERAVEGEECSGRGRHVGPAYSTVMRPIGVGLRAAVEATHVGVQDKRVQEEADGL